MANFAKTQLLKYGWTEGKGLGKNENGITEALKPKLKFNTEGLGHKLEEVQWWESAFNNAAKNVSISSENDEVSISVANTNNISPLITSEENLKENQLRQERYNNFRKTSMLQDEKLIVLKSTDETEEEEKPENKIPLLTDDELFKACGGRTAHKGARHGLSLNGKLERIARQEKKLLGVVSNLSNKEIVNNSTPKSEFTIEDKDEMDNNANAISTATDRSCNQEDGFIKSKSTLKKEKKRMRNLSHLLSVSCNIDENSSSSMIPLNGKKSSLKRKRSKDRKTNVNTDITDGNILSTVSLDHDMSLFTNLVFEKKNKKHKKHNKRKIAKEDSNTSLYDCKTLCHDSTGNASLKLKKKRSKSEENDEVSIEAIHGSKMKKLKYQKKRMLKLMENMNFGGNSEDEQVKNEEKDSGIDVIKVENTFSSDEAVRLNRRITKKKKNRLNKKNKKANLERSISTVFSHRKSGSAMESLMSIDITDDVSAELKASKNMRNIKTIKGKTKNNTDCNTGI